VSRGYGDIPEPARDALERSSAEFTAGRLAERAQHAQQAARAASQASAPPSAQTAPAAQWAWLSIAAMTVPLLVLLLVVLL
jgi:hypothetical protein